MEEILGRVDRLPCPTLAIVDGWCVGGGLAIAACCDLRVASDAASFGMPIARTLGNCLSIGNYARLVAELGIGRVKRMILAGTLITAAEAREAGFLSEVVARQDLDAAAGEWIRRLERNAPVTQRVTKEAIRRVIDSGALAGEDLVRECYGSDDFRRGVRAFLDKSRPDWTGQ